MKGLQPILDTRPPEQQQPKLPADDDALGSMLASKWTQWSTVRREIEENWLEDLRMFNQQNDAGAEQISKFHSHIYIGVARAISLQAYARISDLLFQAADMHWGAEATPVPKSRQNNPADVQFMDIMTARAEAMQKEMEDQLLDLHYEDFLKSCILETCILGTGCVKGVIPGIKKTEQWGFFENQWDVFKSEMPWPKISAPSIFNVYPDPYANRTEDMSGVFERHTLNRQQFSDFRDDSRFDKDKVNEILRNSDRGNHVALWHETTRRDIAKITDATANQAERYDVLEYWGQVSGRMLMSSGVTDVDEQETYWSNVWTCDGKTLLAKVMPMKKQRIPYNFFQYNRIPHQFWGIGPVRMLRSSQLGINGIVRSMLDGMAMTAIPMAEVNVHMLKDGQNPAVLKPGMIYLRDSGDPSVPAIRFFQPSVPTSGLMALKDMFRTFAAEESAMPSYSYGSDSPEINDTTAKGTAMRMNAAALPIKSVVKNLEDNCVKPFLISLFDWNMQWSDKEEIKGDMEIKVLVTSTLMAKEQKTQQLLQFLNLTGNPIDLPLVDRSYLLKQAAKVMEIDVKKAVPDKTEEVPQQGPNPVDQANEQLIQAKIQTEKANAIVKNIEGQYSAIQAAQTIATVPGIVAIADELLKSAGYVDANGTPLTISPGQSVQQNELPINTNTSPMFPANPQSPALGLMNGIETQANDGTLQ
jgi:hypothetical protein